MRAYRMALGALLATALALAALGLWAWPRRVDERAHDAYAERLVRIETLLHRLHEQVLRAHAGLAGSYDPVNQTMRELRELHATATLVPSFVEGGARTEVDAALAASAEVLDAESALVERFKSENAVLLNSLRFFPVAAAEASERLAATPGSEAAAAELRDLLRDVLRLAVAPSDDARAEVARHLAALRAADLGSHNPDIPLLLRHAEVVTQRRTEADRLLRELLDQPDVERARALALAYAHGHTLAVQRDEEIRLAAFALAILLVVLAAMAIILRLSASAAELAETSRQLGLAVEAQNRFVSMTSHEFRTPLSVIVSSAELLGAYSEKWTPENRTKHLRRIDRAARGMTDLLDGLLLIGRTDAGHREFRPGRVDVDALVTESVEAQRLRAKDGTKIELTPSGQTEKVRLDPRLMRHVLDNLIGNGVKYSKPGGVVRVSVTCDGSHLRVEIRDEGIGIPPEHLGRLFDTFARAKNVGAIPGTGLGLAIVKRAVDQHGGTIEASSKVDVGTTFVVQVPVGASAPDTMTSGESGGERAADRAQE